MISRIFFLSVYLAMIAAITFFHFGNHFIEHCVNKYKYGVFRTLFNKKLAEISNADEERYYRVVKKLILYHTYFRHLDLESLIRTYDKNTYEVVCREWKNIRIVEKNVFLFYSTPYNIGFFVPIFLPVAFHASKLIKRSLGKKAG